MSGLPRGLYEQLITEGLEEALSALDPKYRAHRGGLHPEEAADRIAFHLAALVRRSVSALDARPRIEVGARLAGEVTRLLLLRVRVSIPRMPSLRRVTSYGCSRPCALKRIPRLSRSRPPRSPPPPTSPNHPDTRDPPSH